MRQMRAAPHALPLASYSQAPGHAHCTLRDDAWGAAPAPSLIFESLFDHDITDGKWDGV